MRGVEGAFAEMMSKNLLTRISKGYLKACVGVSLAACILCVGIVQLVGWDGTKSRSDSKDLLSLKREPSTIWLPEVDVTQTLLQQPPFVSGSLVTQSLLIIERHVLHHMLPPLDTQTTWVRAVNELTGTLILTHWTSFKVVPVLTRM